MGIGGLGRTAIAGIAVAGTLFCAGCSDGDSGDSPPPKDDKAGGQPKSSPASAGIGPLSSTAALENAVIQLSDLGGEWTEETAEAVTWNKKEIEGGIVGVEGSGCKPLYYNLLFPSVSAPVGTTTRQFKTGALVTGSRVISYGSTAVAQKNFAALKTEVAKCDKTGVDVDVDDQRFEVNKYHVVYENSGAQQQGDELVGLIAQREITDSDVSANEGHSMYGAVRLARVGQNIAIIYLWEQEDQGQGRDLAVREIEQVTTQQVGKLSGG